MKKMMTVVCMLIFSVAFCYSQIPLTVLPSGGNKKAIIGEQIGLTKVGSHPQIQSHLQNHSGVTFHHRWMESGLQRLIFTMGLYQQ